MTSPNNTPPPPPPKDPKERFEHFVIISLPIAITTTRETFSADFQEAMSSVLLRYLDEIMNSEFSLDDDGRVTQTVQAPMQKTNLKTKH